jgi:hypothetical protein
VHHPAGAGLKKIAEKVVPAAAVKRGFITGNDFALACNCRFLQLHGYEYI